MLRFRPPPGSNFELTREMAIKCLEEIEKGGEAGEHRHLDGLRRPGLPRILALINMVLFMRGPDDGQLRWHCENSGVKLAVRERIQRFARIG